MGQVSARANQAFSSQRYLQKHDDLFLFSCISRDFGDFQRRVACVIDLKQSRLSKRCVLFLKDLREGQMVDPLPFHCLGLSL